jgi:superfamily II DNA or RNA helicase
LAFQENVACGSIRNFIKTGVLSPFHAYKIPMWNIELLTAIFCAEPEKWGKSIIFFNRIDGCVTFCENLRRFGMTCDVVIGSSNKDLQLENFASGQTQVIANVSVLSEGFDLPELQSVFIRNASRLPTIQMAGRGLRKSPTKTHCNIIQSIETKFDVEKIAEPEERFRFKRNQWLSCNGNTIPVVQTIERSLELLQNKSVKMPLYLQGGHRRICEVNLRDTMLKQYFSRY